MSNQVLPKTLEQGALESACRRLHFSKKARGRLIMFFNIERTKRLLDKTGLVYKESRKRDGARVLKVELGKALVS